MTNKYPLQSIAWGLAERHHQGQRYGKHPYTYHLGQVCEGVRRAATKQGLPDHRIDEVCAVAILHDILEDTDCDLTDLTMAEVPLGLQFSIMNLTKVEGESYDNYIRDILSDPLALMVKREDTMMNLTQSQHEGSEKRVRKYSMQLARLYP